MTGGVPNLKLWRTSADQYLPALSCFIDVDGGTLTFRLALREVFAEVLTTIANSQIIW